MKKTNESEKRQRRVSFHPAQAEKKEDEVEQQKIDVSLFDTQKYAENSLIVEFDKRKREGRMSLDPLCKLDIADESVQSEGQLKQEKTKVNYNFREKAKRNNFVDDFMYGYEIRFLDKIITNMGEKTGQQTGGNKYSGEKRMWLKYSLRPRVEFLKGMVRYLQAQMRVFQNEIDVKQRSLDVNKVKTGGLKRHRNESRNRAKLEWYAYRKVQETHFNKTILENEQKMLLEKVDASERLSYLKKEIEELKKTRAKIKERIGSVDVAIGEKSILNREELEDLKYKLMEQVNRSEVLKEDEEILKKKVFEKEMECRIVRERIKELTADIGRLDCTILGKNADDSQLENLSRTNLLYEDVFGVRLIKAETNRVVLGICGFEFTFMLSGGSNVKSFVCSKKNRFDKDAQIYDTFFVENMLADLIEADSVEPQERVVENKDEAYAEKMVQRSRKRRLSVAQGDTMQADEFTNTLNLENTLDIFMVEKLQEEMGEMRDPIGSSMELEQSHKLDELVHKILYKYHTVNSLMKEVCRMRDWCNIDGFYVKNKIYYRFYLQTLNSDCGLLDLSIDRMFNLIHDKQIVVNLRNNVEGIRKYVNEFISNK
ncbi:hypothetical protein ECANGB1_1700 [Enterospora canceri]|uniref:Spc7 kinetochore protein domain-containing protein n=1 Tax=Enterospora canceri TaxID=1081671 RepID=A0A1Y1S968_9MICR|nr:hypothetical protein ECANGB1_1700 [Enterospora canceri]